jgi:uncharacterized protein (TIGR02996 family)
MNPQDFVPAIREHPDDDLPRLACADWFEEHSQPERAEFIRAQIELARLDPKARRRRRMQERADELLAAHEEEWAGPLLELVNKVRFRRGFVERVTLTLPDFLDSADRLFALAPIREASFVRAGPDLGELAGCPHLARLALLDFRDRAFAAEELRALFDSPHLCGLRAFILRLGGPGDDVIQALTASERPPPLTTLDLYDADLETEAIEALAAWPGATTLRALILGGNYMAEGAAVALVDSPHLAGLQTLHLAFANLGDDDARALAASPHLAGLQRLDLRHNNISAEGATRLRERFGDRVNL